MRAAVIKKPGTTVAVEFTTLSSVAGEGLLKVEPFAIYCIYQHVLKGENQYTIRNS
jgi:hypothetical protein